MNTIFVKEVTSSVMGKNIVKLNLVNISDNNYIIELNMNSKKLADISTIIQKKDNIHVINKNNGIKSKIQEIQKEITLKKFKKDIKKIVNKNELVGYSVIFSNEFKKKYVKQYIEELLNNFSINEYLCLNSMKQNYLRYIEEYILNNNIKKENINVLLIANDLSNIDMEIVEKLNNEYKELNIFSGNKPSKSFQNKIKKINDETGAFIQILGKNSKDFRKYNICVFIDKSRDEYLKYKFNRKACYIDFTNKENDKFNKKYLKLEEDIKSNKYYNNKIRELYELYGKITVANVIID